MKKPIILLAVVLTVIILFQACDRIFFDHLSKKQIFALVSDNEELLLQCIAENDFEKAYAIKGISYISVEEKIIEFGCGGSGFGSGTSYYGFYYTTDDNMTAIWCAGPVVPDGRGYSWTEENGDNRYYTEKICDCFYYYEASF